MSEPAARAADLVRRRPPRAGRTRVVAVDGPSGSGKTAFAGALSAVLAGVPVLHMDDLYPGWEGLEDAVPLVVEQVLVPLAAGRDGRYRRYDWLAGRYAEEHAVPAGDFVVVEGVGSGARACAPYLSLLVWLEAAAGVRLARGLARDGEAYRPHWQRWAMQEQAHFRVNHTRERASLIVDTTNEGV